MQHVPHKGTYRWCQSFQDEPLHSDQLGAQLRLFVLALQARIEAVGQVLMWKAVEAGPGLQRLGRRSRRPARAASDRYEEHMLLPDDRVALLSNQRLMLVSAPGFAKVGKAPCRSQLVRPPRSQWGHLVSHAAGTSRVACATLSAEESLKAAALSSWKTGCASLMALSAGACCSGGGRPDWQWR